MVVCFVTRCQYYCVWKLVEAAVVVTGLGFNGHDDKGNSKWDGVRNVEIFKLETAQNLRYIVANWNMVRIRCSVPEHLPHRLLPRWQYTHYHHHPGLDRKSTRLNSSH